MSGELPPAVARFVADAEPFQRGAGQAENAANKFGREADKAALSARRMGLAAKEAGEKAAVAQRLAAEAAEKAAKGMLKESEAAEKAARAVRELERAELAQAAAAIATAEASEKAARAHHKQADAVRALGRDADKAGNILTRGLARGADMAEASLGQLSTMGQVSVAAVAAGLVALPLVGAAVGGAITLGLGGALVGLGLYASKGSKKVRSELAALKSDVKAEAREMSRPFEQTWVTIARTGRAAFKDLSQTTMRASFVRLAPEVSTFAARSIASLSRLKPVITSVEHAASALMRSLGPQMPAIMDSLAAGVTAVTSAVGDNPQVITTMVQGLADTVRVGGEVIGTLTRVAAVMQRNKDSVMAFMTILNPFLGGLTALGKSLGDTDTAASQVGRAVATAMDAANAAQLRAAVSAQTQTSAQQQLKNAMQSSATTADQLKAAMDRLTGTHQSADQAEISFRNSIAAATRGIKEHGRGLDLNSQKGRDNYQALIQVAQGAQEHMRALRADHASMTTVNAAAADARGRFIALATSMTGSASKARELANRLLGIKSRHVKVNVDTGTATGALNQFIATSSGRVIQIGVQIRSSAQEFGALKSSLGHARGGPVRRAGGGAIEGPGTATSDSVPILASNGEYVINAKSTRRHLSLIEAINADKFANGGQVGFASGGRVTTVGGVAVSTAQWRNLGLQLGKDFLKAMTGSKSEIASMDRRLEKAIAKLFAGKRTSLDNKLIAYLDRNSSRMEALAVRRDAASKALAAGKEYAGTLTGNTRSYAALSGLDGPTSGAQIRQGLAMKLSGITQFANVLKALGKRGLSKSLLRQVMDMGPEDGTRYGQMLLSADKGTFKDINAVQAAIDSSSRALGRSGADMLYDAGKMAGKGFLTGLQAQIKGLDKVMDHLALRMSKALKKALHIKSPSQLPAIRQAGAMTVAGVAAGMNANLGVIDLAAERMARRLTQPRIRPTIAPVVQRGHQPPAQAGGGGQPIELRVYLDGREIRAVVQQQTLRYNKRNANNGLSLTGTS